MQNQKGQAGEGQYLGDTNFSGSVRFSVPVLELRTFADFFPWFLIRVRTFTASFFGSFSDSRTFLRVFFTIYLWKSNSCPTIPFLEFISWFNPFCSLIWSISLAFYKNPILVLQPLYRSFSGLFYGLFQE